MKKLMIAAAIVCAAALSQAASCSWGTTSIIDSPDNAKAAGWAVYLLSASDFDAFSALDADKVAAFAIANNIDDGVTSAGGRGMILVDAKTGDNYSKGQSENAFLVLFDNADATQADNFAYTATLQSAAVGDGGADISLAFGDFATAIDGQGGWQSTASVPEPTSGLLLLLGVAGLALRRRRA